MAKNSKDAYGASGNTSLLMFDPNVLTIVEDPKHPLFDERVNLPVSETLIANILHHGRILQSVSIRKNPETGKVEVVAGRRRVRAAREINRRKKENKAFAEKWGKDPIRVPAVVERSRDSDLMDVMVSENEQREGDTPLVRAEKMRRLLDRGKTESEIQVLFGVSVATVKNTLALLEASSTVKKAVDSGKISVATAYKLAKLPAPEQKEKVAQLLAEAPATPGKKNKKARRAREIVSGTSAIRAEKAIRELRAKVETEEKIRENARLVALAVLDWVLGTDGALGCFYDEPEEAAVLEEDEEDETEAAEG